MARQSMSFYVRGVGGGRAGRARVSAPRMASYSNRRAGNHGRSKV